MLWLNLHCTVQQKHSVPIRFYFCHNYKKICLQSCDDQVTFDEKMADEQVSCASCGRSTVL